jgi:hypothetical protein
MTEQLCEGHKQNKWFPGVKASPAERVHGHQIFISLWLLPEIDPADPWAMPSADNKKSLEPCKRLVSHSSSERSIEEIETEPSD